jgi:hypothetical protein
MVNELQAVVDELGGKPALGRSFKKATDLQTAIREGFPQSVVEEVMHAAGLTLKELANTPSISRRVARNGDAAKGGWRAMIQIVCTGLRVLSP